VGLNYNERKKNVSGAFTANATMCDNKAILLIDDVTTTFSTLNACATALRNAGARSVYCFTVARTLYQSEKEQK